MFASSELTSPQRKMALLALSKIGGGTPVLSGLCAKFCSIVDVGVGIYEITVNTQQPFAQNVIATAMLHASGVITKDVALSDKLKITIKTYQVNGTTAADLDFDLIVVGSYATDLIG